MIPNKKKFPYYIVRFKRTFFREMFGCITWFPYYIVRFKPNILQNPYITGGRFHTT